jgi:hypothetical protein
MKIKFIIALVLILAFSFAVSAQKNKNEKPNKPKPQAQTAPKEKVRILSFSRSEKMFEILDGKWSYMEIDCSKAITIKVAPDRETIKLIYPKSVAEEKNEFVFLVNEVTDYYIRGQYEGEQRKTDDGKTFMWDFMFLSADEFVWHRTDWQGLGATPPVTRCKEEKQIALLK